MRADKFFTQTFGSRSRAQNALKAGRILRDGKPLSPSDEVADGENFVISDEFFVSEGAKKLLAGLEGFGESVEGAVCADLGASTGGFTDVLLRRGAKKVFCIDVGESQLDAKLCADERVTVFDRTNARYLTAESFPCPVDVVTADLSFISLRLILPAVAAILQDGGRAFVLFKPQFECGGEGLTKRGILPPVFHYKLLHAFYAECNKNGLAPCGILPAPVLAKKNVEYIVFLRKGGHAMAAGEFASAPAKLPRK